MIEHLRQLFTSQFEAALAMLGQCIRNCPPQHWEGKIPSGTCRQIAYHTLFFADLYLSPSNESFVLHDLHGQGGDEREPGFARGLAQDETLGYVAVCRQKAVETLAADTPQSLAGPSGFEWYPVSRAELHLINLRHIQHHTGQLNAYLRRCDEGLREPSALRWIGSGWR